MALLVLLTSLASGCLGETSSGNLQTGGVLPNFEAIHDGSGKVVVTASLFVDGSLTLVELEQGDALIAQYGEDRKAFGDNRDPVAITPQYVAEFAGYVPEQAVTVEFVRNDGEEPGASTVVIPSGFDVQFDADGDTVARNALLDLIWSNPAAGYPMSIEAMLRCPTDGGDEILLLREEDLQDIGSYMIDVMRWLETDEAELASAGECPANVTIRREDFGEVGEGYAAGGTFDGIQQRTFEFRVDLARVQ